MKHAWSRLKSARGLAVYAALGAFAVFAMAAPICGSPTPQPTPIATTPTAAETAPAASGIDVTATAVARLNTINAKLVAHGEPTVAAVDDPSAPIGVPEPAAPAGAPSPNTTPRPPSCGGGAITGGEEIVAAYGEVSGCGVYDSQLIFITVGAADNAGGIATFQCAQDDDDCLHARAPRTAGAWTFFPDPGPGGGKILAFVPPDRLVISGNFSCFNLTTHRYIASSTCQ